MDPQEAATFQEAPCHLVLVEACRYVLTMQATSSAVRPIAERSLVPGAIC